MDLRSGSAALIVDIFRGFSTFATERHRTFHISTILPAKQTDKTASRYGQNMTHTQHTLRSNNRHRTHEQSSDRSSASPGNSNGNRASIGGQRPIDRPPTKPSGFQGRGSLSLPSNSVTTAVSTWFAQPQKERISPLDERPANTVTLSDRNISANHKAKPMPLPSVIHLNDIPGSIGLHRLVQEGIVVALTESSGYLKTHGETLYGRASVMESILPYGLVACASTAAWVWLGGDFPSQIEVVANTHFRTSLHGRTIRVHDRSIPGTHVMMRLKQLMVTSPLRTACDIACMSVQDKIMINAPLIMIELLERYELTTERCIHELWNTPNWHRHNIGVRAFMELEERISGKTIKGWESAPNPQYAKRILNKMEGSMMEGYTVTSGPEQLARTSTPQPARTGGQQQSSHEPTSPAPTQRPRMPNRGADGTGSA